METKALEEIVLTDFQVHRRLSIDFAPGITTIVGPSDAGKSAAIRALRWLVFNAPQGEDFIRWGAKKTTVELTLDGGKTLKRGRGKDGNFYAIDGQKLVSFGTAVPGPVNEILGLGPVNFQQQHDSPFWLAETAGEVSRNLNAIVNLQIIDEVLTDLATQKRSAVLTVNVAKERLAQARAALRGFDHVTDFLADTKTLEDVADEAAIEYGQAAALRRVYDTARQTHEKADQYARKAAAATRLRDAALAAANSRKRQKRASVLVDRILVAKEIIDRPRPDMGPLDQALVKYKASCANVALLQRQLGAVAAAHKMAEDKATKAAAGAKALAEAIKKMKVCPVCQRPT